MVLGMLLDARSSCLILALVFESRVSKMVPGSRRAWVSVSRLFHGILSAAVNTSWSERAEVNRLSMGISGRWTSVGLGTRGVSLGTDASLRTTRADAGVAVASAVVAVSSSSPFSLSLSLSFVSSAFFRLVSFAQLVSIRFLAYLRIAVPRVVAASPPLQKSTRSFSSYYYFHASPVWRWPALVVENYVNDREYARNKFSRAHCVCVCVCVCVYVCFFFSNLKFEKSELSSGITNCLSPDREIKANKVSQLKRKEITTSENICSSTCIFLRLFALSCFFSLDLFETFHCKQQL